MKLYVWSGGLTLRVSNERIWCIRPPWNRPLFSERHGLVDMKFQWLGWRFFARTSLGHQPSL